MSDIVERLRRGIGPNTIDDTIRAMARAAAEIERLRTENVALSIDHAEMVNECRAVRAATIEECATIGDMYGPLVGVAIRALGEQK